MSLAFNQYLNRLLLALAAIILCCVSLSLPAQSTEFTFYSSLAEDWYTDGQYFEWTSTTPGNNGAKVNIFYKTSGDPKKPKLLLVHGFPNSSFDYYKLIPLLQDQYHIAILDFPGSGFSDKPVPNFSYMIEDNALLLDYFIREVVQFEDFALFTHDRGVSIGLAFLGNYLDAVNPGYKINYHFLSNSGMFLPLANLVPFQLALLDAERGPALIAARKNAQRMTSGDPETLAYSDLFKFNDGDSALLHVGRYLLERAENESRWLNNLKRSDIPVAYLWGLLDDVNPIRIPNYVWLEYLNDRAVESSFWILPTAGHYPQREKPEQVAKIVNLALNKGIPSRSQENDFMRSYAGQRASEDAVFVGHSEIKKMVFPSDIIYTPEGYLEAP
jgi:pimeloyl-ACP methyl ester carboxylesterase